MTVSPIELWGGVECTVNRVGDRYRDQIRLSGHEDRLTDLDLFAALGLSAIRYPVLWERSCRNGDASPDWAWPDARLNRLRALGIRPIVGLVHHGSGPSDTDLLAEDFAPRLARYAAAVAERYPWVEDWTPINEPLTTARFSALYGHWYPHATAERAFWLALLNQVDAIRLAMRAVRRVNPRARLIQTDDLGRTHATEPLIEQAEHDNLRRWAGWDLLFGMVDAAHPLFASIAALGFGDRLRRIANDPCPPDIVGVNHYLTSDRFLDHRLERYPAHLHGGNGRIAYADTEAVRIVDPPVSGLADVLQESWDRYSTPVALTEVHNGCTREEQMRWAAEAWDSAARVKADGADVRAVTAWSLLGSHGWDTLLTADGHYESGVHDMANGRPRPTALASLWRGLPLGAPRHPVLDGAGWWRRPERLIFATPAPEAVQEADAAPAGDVLILGATGTLGQAFARACDARGIAHRLSGRQLLDLERPGAIDMALDAIRPWAVVNAAGWVRVDDAEGDEEACRRVNAAGAIELAQACAARGIGCLNISSDLVFGGEGDRPLVEDDPTRPLNAYGRSKAVMEEGCAHLKGSLVVRTAAFFSPHDRFNFARAVVATLGAGDVFVAAEDHVVSPTFVPALVDRALDLMIDGEEGVWHLSDGVALSWADFASRIADACDLDSALVRAVPGDSLGWRAPRPRYVPLGSVRGGNRGFLDESVGHFAHHLRQRAA